MKRALQSVIVALDATITAKLKSFDPRYPNVTKTEEKILSILKSNSRVKQLDNESSVRNAILWAVRNSLPINIAIVWALGAHARSSYKILDWQKPIPRLGDLWAFYWFHLLNEKIKKIYSPGICVTVIDEVPQSELIGWSKDEMDVRKEILLKLNPCPNVIKIIDMPNFDLKEASPPIQVSPQEIFCVITVIENNDTEKQALISSDLYNKELKDWENIKQLVGEKEWVDAEKIAIKMATINHARKESEWLLNEIYDGQEYIDACINRKGRWCPSIWDGAFPQHGGALLDYNTDGRFIVRIIPEYRLKSEGRTQIEIEVSDFEKLLGHSLQCDGCVTFHWE